MIIITKQPSLYTPSQNPIIWEFSTENKDVLYFNVITRTMTEAGPKVLSKGKIFVAPDSTENKAYIDLSRVLASYVNTPLSNSDNTIENLDGYLTYYLEVSGYDNAGNRLETAITTDTNYCYNGAVNVYRDEVNVFFKDNYISNFLTNTPLAQKAHHTQDIILYFLANNTSNLAYFHTIIKFKNGTQQTKIINFTNPSNQSLHRLKLKYSSLAEEYNVLVSDIKNVTIVAYSSSNIMMSEERIFFPVAYECRVDAINLIWENKCGGYDSHAFAKPKKAINVEKQKLKTNGFVVKENGVYSPTERTIKVNSEVTYTVISAPLSDAEYDVMSEIIASRNVYVEDIKGDLIPIQLKETSITVLQKRYTKAINRLTLSFTADDSININTYTDEYNQGFDYVLDFGITH